MTLYRRMVKMKPMNTIIGKITGNNTEDGAVIQRAAEIIKNGGLAAFPTETVYGLGGDAFDAGAAARIYAAKGRPSDNPLIVHIAETEDLARLSDRVPDAAYALAERFWPGPLTVIVRKNSLVPDTVTGGLDTVAVRLPSHEVARRLIKASGTFIAAPSANISGRPSPTSARHVIEDMSGRIDMIIDAGDIELGLESTIVDLTGEEPVMLRPGFVTMEMLKAVLGRVSIDPAVTNGISGDIRPRAPGMKYRHYAPKADMTVVEGDKKAAAEKIRELVKEGVLSGKRVGVMTTRENRSFYDEGEIVVLGSGSDMEEIARNLFGALRSFDDRGVEIIYSEAFSGEGLGRAVMNRLLKAAGQNIIKV